MARVAVVLLLELLLLELLLLLLLLLFLRVNRFMFRRWKFDWLFIFGVTVIYEHLHRIGIFQHNLSLPVESTKAPICWSALWSVVCNFQPMTAVHFHVGRLGMENRRSTFCRNITACYVGGKGYAGGLEINRNFGYSNRNFKPNHVFRIASDVCPNVTHVIQGLKKQLFI